MDEEGYPHEVIICGFWTGNETFPEPAFYCSYYPEPARYKNALIQPGKAYYYEMLGEFIPPYIIVQQSKNPEETLMIFLGSTYEAGAEVVSWNRIRNLSSINWQDDQL